MLDAIFLKVISMSATASIIILCVLLARLFLKNVPKIFCYALWAVVLLRLLCPFSLESGFSLLPNTLQQHDTMAQWQDGYIGQTHIFQDNRPEYDIAVSNGIAPIASDENGFYVVTGADGISAPKTVGNTLVPKLAVLWLLGALILWIYSFVCFYRLSKKVKAAVYLKENIYLYQPITTAFVLGVFQPKIYLPFGLTEKEKDYVLLHEQTHIQRRDHLIKIVAFTALCIHWFNPLVWIAFFAAAKDMELSCDEAVMKKMGSEIKKEYASCLLKLAIGKQTAIGTPLGFGEGDTKSRVKNVLAYKAPKFWAGVLSCILVIVLGIGFAVNPKPSRSFAMAGDNLCDLQPLQISQEIGQIVKTDFSQLKITSDNFDVMVTSDFDFASSGASINGAIRFLYDIKDQNAKAAQLRFFGDQKKFFVTEPEDWPAPKEQIFSFYIYLEALKYLPKEEIKSLCEIEPQRYAISIVQADAKYNEGRQIFYNKNGVAKEPQGYHIRLDIQPMYSEEPATANTASSFHGFGTDIIHVYYSAREQEASGVSIQTGDSLFSPRLYENEFQFQYDELPVLKLNKENQTLPIHLTMDFGKTAYLGFDAYKNNTITQSTYELKVNNHTAYLNIGNEKQELAPYLDSKYDYIICYLKSDLNKKAEYVFRIELDENLDEANNKMPLTYSQAVSKALADKSREGECFSQGHIILGTEKIEDSTKIYALTMVGQYGFVNNHFEKIGGSGMLPAVITLNNDNTVSIQYPTDGNDYTTSITQMFPKKYHSRILQEEDRDYQILKEQEVKQAQAYLLQLDRTAQIGDYGDFKHTLLTSLGVSVEVSNKLEEFYKLHNCYPYFIGTKEMIENGARMVYEMGYEKTKHEIWFKKFEYGSKEILEQFIFNADTGEQVVF